MARLPQSTVSLAAYGGVVFPVALLVESPILMLLTASTALARDLAHDKGAMTRMIDTLEDKGLVERERDPDDRLAFEVDRLHRSCRRLIWLNPLLRFEGFEAKAKGIQAMLPHVDEFRPIHNLDSMGELIAALSAARADPGRWRGAVA